MVDYFGTSIVPQKCSEGHAWKAQMTYNPLGWEYVFKKGHICPICGQEDVTADIYKNEESEL